MPTYLYKSQWQPFNEILELIVRAKEIVVRNSPYNLEYDPKAVFNVLKQNFGEAISPVPMQPNPAKMRGLRINKPVVIVTECKAEGIQLMTQDLRSCLRQCCSFKTAPMNV